LLLEYISRNAFSDEPIRPKEFFFIDPIIVPSTKLLHIVDVVGPILGNSPQEFTTDAEKQHWYTNRPASTLIQLNDLCVLMQGKLEDGFSLPSGARAKCYKSKTDPSVDPISALLIYKGLTDASGGKIDVEMEESNLHVFTQLAARAQVSNADRALQQRVFKEMIDRAVASR
jgi:carboxylesterase